VRERASPEKEEDHAAREKDERSPDAETFARERETRGTSTAWFDLIIAIVRSRAKGIRGST
jgi:hypothetical protein